MNQNLCAIVSSVPERISVCTQSLRPLTANVLFYSDLHSLLRGGSTQDLSAIIIDHVEPDPDVVRIIREARRDGALASLAVILISGSDACPASIDALEAGADDFLPLASVPQRLLGRVRLHLDRYSALMSLSPETEAFLTAVDPKEDRRVLRNAMLAVRQDVGGIKNVQELSVQIGHTVDSVTQAFRTHLNMTVFQFLRRERINRAKTLLAGTGIPIKEIAQDLGYSTAPNFATAFKQQVGVTPTEYRQSSIVNSITK